LKLSSPNPAAFKIYFSGEEEQLEKTEVTETAETAELEN
jgi:hypothetical protein